MNAYQESLKIKRDNYSALESAELRGEQRGQKQGIEIGAEQEKREMARELKKEGLSIDLIARTTKLSVEEIQTLI
ncbi:hypothetical protein [Pedobacter nutrimenti]|uniref:hypothetical protein n=1 Tax=Pedobacter nutrimenti TaxID=1241337 RepID=UPI00292FA3D8|nr:hypothetical protein [Pedobacter nutrimenti]